MKLLPYNHPTVLRRLVRELNETNLSGNGVYADESALVVSVTRRMIGTATLSKGKISFPCIMGDKRSRIEIDPANVTEESFRNSNGQSIVVTRRERL